MWLLLALGAMALAAWAPRANSRKEDMPETNVSIPVENDALAAAIAPEWGKPYFYGHAGPDDFDCSGFLWYIWRKLGIWTGGRRSAKMFAMDCDPVPVGEQRPGDAAYYPGHVMLVTSFPRAEFDGHSAVCGASGGTRSTMGDDPNARVKGFPTALYRKDFVCYMRPKAGKGTPL